MGDPGRPIGRALGPIFGVALWGSIAAASPPQPSAEAAEAPRAAPALWRALRPDGSEAYHLLGSVHLGRPSTLRLPGAVDDAFARAQELVLEVPPEELTPETAAEQVALHARIAPPATLRDRLSADALAALSRHLEMRGQSLDAYLQLEPWFIALEIDVREAERAGLDPDYGVDRHFAWRASGRMPVVALESAREQMRLLSELPADVQELLLMDRLLRTDRAGRGVAGLVAAWERGDLDAVERIVYGPLFETPRLAVFYERLVLGRNESMTQRLASLARDGKRRFVVIGAGHTVGARGVPALLRDYGFRVERVR